MSPPTDGQPALRYLAPTGPGPAGAGGHDLAVDPGGRPRPGWGRMLEAIVAIGPGELDRRQRAADRQMLAQGAGMLLHEGAEDALRPWRLDVIPLVIDHEAWAPIAAGLAQRAEVLAAVVADLHGRRTLLSSGVIPIEAVAAHGTALRTAWDGRRPPRLLVVGADLVVDGGGRVRVLRDLTDVPTGDGHALLARSIVERALPHNRRALGVAAHRPYTVALRTALLASAPPGHRSPRTVVLTGAPDEPGHVEHAYLATRLGYDVAEAADVVVRRGRAWLRSLEGLEPIDVLLRRLPQRELDPVEDDIVGDEGVAGVVGAERAQGVHLANPYGAAVGESPALLPFLDAASRFLSGRPLALGAVEALWCGDPDQRARFAAAPEDFAVHDLGAPLAPAVALKGLTDAGVAAWLARVAERPERYVARPGLTVATAPTFVGGRLRPAPVALRAQVLLAPGGPVVLPGGHGRVLEAGSAGPLADRAEGVGKDVWVLGPVSRSRVTVAAEAPQVDLRRSLPTRAAEALYWVGRHAERAEAAARMVLAAGTHGIDVSARDTAALARALRVASGGLPLNPPGPPCDLDTEVRDALAGRLSSVTASLRATTAAARGARPLLSGGTWRLLPMLDEQAAVLDELAKTPTFPAFATSEALDGVLVPLAALAGLTNESVVRGPGWRFLDMGRRLERALLVLGLAEATLAGPYPTAGGPPVPGGADPEAGEPGAPGGGDLLLQPQPAVEAVLAACESLVAYRRRYRSDVTVAAAADLLLGDVANPRSVRFQLDELTVDLHSLPDRPVRRAQLAAVRSAAQVLDRRLPLAADPAGKASSPGDQGAGGAVARLVLEARGPLLEVGSQMAPGWFIERPRRVR